MFPLFFNLYQPSSYYPQYPLMLQPNTGFSPYYHQTENVPPVQNLLKEPRQERQVSDNDEESSKKSSKIYRRKVKKVDNEYRVKDQNAQRNIISNIAHHLMSYIRKEGITREIIDRIIRVHNIDITSEQFFVAFRRIKLRNYVRKITLEDLWQNKHNPKFTKILRILSYQFLNERCYCSILFSRKIKKPLKPHHLPKIRELAHFLSRGRDK